MKIDLSVVGQGFNVVGERVNRTSHGGEMDSTNVNLNVTTGMVASSSKNNAYANKPTSSMAQMLSNYISGDSKGNQNVDF